MTNEEIQALLQSDPFSDNSPVHPFSNEYIQQIVELANASLQNKFPGIPPDTSPPVSHSFKDTIMDFLFEEEESEDAPQDKSKEKPKPKPKTVEKKGRKIKGWQKTAITFAVAFGAATVIRSSGLLTTNFVEGESMEPNYYTGDLVFTSTLPSIDRYDVVTALAPTGTQVIKRVIGVPGDVIRTEGAHIYVNGKLSDESFISEDTFNDTNDDVVYEIPEGYYFLAGDNRSHSTDSRVYGPVAESQVHGQVIITVPISSDRKS